MNIQRPRFGELKCNLLDGTQDLYIGFRAAHIGSRRLYDDVFQKLEKSGLDIAVDLHRGGTANKDDQYAAISLKDRATNKRIGHPQYVSVNTTTQHPNRQKFTVAGLEIFNTAFALGIQELANRLP